MDSNASLKDNYKSISDKIAQAKKDSNVNKNIIFIAVSKKRSVEDIKVIYEQGHRIFGENYVNELLEKSEQLPKDIEWHLIGHLQSNKVKKVLEKIPTITIESVDSVKLSDELNKNCSKLGITSLNVYIEINISNSTTKTGADLSIIDDIAKNIVEKCPNLKLKGIMSLGNIGNKEEFAHMLKIKEEFCEKYKLDKDSFVASFGTSQDFEDAIKAGCDEVRIGHQIFDTNK